MYPYLRIGPYLIQLSGIALLVGVWIGLTLVEKETVRLRLDTGKITNVVFFSLIAGLVGARLGYVLQFLDVYTSNPLSLFSLDANTLSPKLGLLTGVVLTLIMGQRHQLALRPTLDALAPGLAFFMVALGVAHILSGDAYGAPTHLPWSVFLWSEYRHPSQIFETIAAISIFLIAMRRPLERGSSGLNFLFVIAASAFARIFLEAFRGDSSALPGGFRTAQVAGLAVLALSIFFIHTWNGKNLSENQEGNLEG